MRIAQLLFRRWVLLLALVAFTPLVSTAAEALVLNQPQLAGISGFRGFRDTPIVLNGSADTLSPDGLLKL